MRLTVAARIAAPPEVVWQHLTNIAAHTEWMADARSIDFLTPQRRGVGTRFACRTGVWFLTTTDVMEITEWAPAAAMGVRHTGAVSGEGRFELRPGAAENSTALTWDERLRFPWWLGGPAGELLARPVLRRIWRRNLTRLAHVVETNG